MSEFDPAEILNNVYQSVKRCVEFTHQEDITWQEARDLEKLTEKDFLCESAWVIVNSGFRYETARKIWPDLSGAFHDFNAAWYVVYKSEPIRIAALRAFKNKAKIDAMLKIARIVNDEGWSKIHGEIKSGGIDYLERFPFIGPITKFHLAKAIGIDCVKPDRHLERIAKAAGYDSPLSMCEVIKEKSGDKLAVIDIVLWRFAVTTPAYIEHFAGLNG